MASATSIIAVYTPSKIVVVGDSFFSASWTDKRDIPRAGTIRKCKVNQFGAVFIAATGNYLIQNAHFDFWMAARRVCGAAQSVTSCSEGLVPAVRIGLQNPSDQNRLRRAKNQPPADIYLL